MKPYLSSSQLKSFMGCPAKPGCPAKAIAIQKGEWIEKKSPALLEGGYVDAYFSGTLDIFKTENHELFTQKGELYAKYENLNEIIKYIESDELLMKFLSGKKQRKVSGMIAGAEYIGYIDAWHEHSIVDLKVIRDFEPVWCDGFGKLNFIDAWLTTEQLAIYQELDFQMTGVKKLCYVAAVTKEASPDKIIVHVPDEVLQESLFSVQVKTGKTMQYKTGEIEAERCEKCDYCKSTKVLTKVTSYFEL